MTVGTAANPENVDAATFDTVFVDTVIVGCGFAGLGLAIRLERAQGKLGSYVVLERGEDVGGTWRDNVYPGVACDVPSHLYSFSFRPKADWSRFFSPGAEILEYLRDAAREEGILPHIRLREEVVDLRWDHELAQWEVRSVSGRFRSRRVVIATGRLSEPFVPDVPGHDGFDGISFHSAQWSKDIDLAGRRVGLVGTGASAVQILPALAVKASEVVLFQRSPAYVVPRGDRAYTDDEKAAFSTGNAARETVRTTLFWDMEGGFAARLKSAEPFEALAALARGHRDAQVRDPALREAVTPDYEIGCKRVLLSDDYNPALEQESVRLEASPVAEIEGSTVTAASCTEPSGW